MTRQREEHERRVMALKVTRERRIYHRRAAMLKAEAQRNRRYMTLAVRGMGIMLILFLLYILVSKMP